MRPITRVVLLFSLALSGCKVVDLDQIQIFGCGAQGACASGLTCCSDGMCRASCSGGTGGGTAMGGGGGAMGGGTGMGGGGGDVDAGDLDAGDVDAGEVDAGEIDAGAPDAGLPCTGRNGGA